jgi:ABC-type antimicrobial peptide transport system permease subunit
MALGAQRNAVHGLVMRQAGWLTVTGLALGLFGAVGVAKLIRKMLQWRQALCRRGELLLSIQYKLCEANDAVTLDPLFHTKHSGFGCPARQL